MLRRLNFNFWYFFHPPWDSGISPPELLDFLAHHPPGRAIDIGCGTGTNTVTLAQHAWQATGIDFAARAIQLARRKVKQAGVAASLLVGDATRLRGISGPFDLALDLGCFHGIPNRSAYLAQLIRVLAPGGYWLLYAILKNTPDGSRPGLTPADVELIQSSGLQLVNRTDGWDKRDRPSAWFLFRRPTKT